MAGRRTVRRLVVREGRGDEALRSILALAREKKIRVDFVSREVFRKGCPHKSGQGVMAEVMVASTIPLDELLDIPGRKGESAFFMLLDGVEDPRNLGAVIRVAESTGVQGLVLPSRRSATLGATAARTSAGAMDFLEFTVLSNIKTAVAAMHDRGIMVYGAEAGRGDAPWMLDFTGDVAIVLGGEGRGVRPSLLDACDGIVSLPQCGRLNSLNISVAAGMLAYEVVRQRSGR